MRRRWLALGCATFLIGLIAFLPASLIEAPLNRALTSQATMTGTSGTLWSGSGLVQVLGQSLPVHWRMAPLALLRLRLGVVVSSMSPVLSGQARLSIGLTDARLDDTDLNLDGKLINADGRVKLNGDGQLGLDAKREFVFSGWATPTRDAAQLTALLQSVGKLEPDGRIRIDYRGSLK